MARHSDFEFTFDVGETNPRTLTFSMNTTTGKKLLTDGDTVLFKKGACVGRHKVHRFTVSTDRECTVEIHQDLAPERTFWEKATLIHTEL